MEPLEFLMEIMRVQRTPGALEIRILKRERWITENDTFKAKSYYITDEKSGKDVLRRVEYLNKRKKFEVYYGLNLSKEDLGKKSGKKSHVIENPTLFFADVDVLHKENIKDLEHFEAAMKNDKSIVKDFKNAIRTWALSIKNHLENEKLPPLAVVYSGWGIQIIFLSPRPIPKKEYEEYEAGLVTIVNEVLSKNEFRAPPSMVPYLKKQKFKVAADRIFNVDRILRVPGFRNWRCSTWVKSELLFERFSNPRPVNMKVVERGIEKYRKEREHNYTVNFPAEGEIMRGYGPYAWKGIVEISDATVNEVAEILSKYWVEGQRHDLSLVAAGFFRAYGYTPESVEKVFRKIILMTGDEEAKNRFDSITTTYEKPPIKSGIKYSVRRFLIEKINDSNLRADVKKRRIAEIENDMKKLNAIIWNDIKRAKEEGRLKSLVIKGKTVNKL